MFKALAEFYNEDRFRFEFKTFGERNNALKILERAGFDYELVEDLRPFVIKLSKYSKYAPLLKNSISHIENQIGGYPHERPDCVENPGGWVLRCIKKIMRVYCSDRRC
jgi:hypothetical protein